eukprot:213604-Chlamydomonas_euryale.AAC.24
MGAGGDGRPARDSLMRKTFSFDKLPSFANVKDDLNVLKHIWFSKAQGADHAARLEAFYSGQAGACEFCAASAALPLTFALALGPPDPFISDILTPSDNVAADDKFRANFLWGRKPMLASCAARLEGKRDMIWVDLGGGTGVSGAASCFNGCICIEAACLWLMVPDDRLGRGDEG